MSEKLIEKCSQEVKEVIVIEGKYQKFLKLQKIDVAKLNVIECNLLLRLFGKKATYMQINSVVELRKQLKAKIKKLGQVIEC